MNSNLKIVEKTIIFNKIPNIRGRAMQNCPATVKTLQVHIPHTIINMLYTNYLSPRCIYKIDVTYIRIIGIFKSKRKKINLRFSLNVNKNCNIWPRVVGQSVSESWDPKLSKKMGLKSHFKKKKFNPIYT